MVLMLCRMLWGFWLKFSHKWIVALPKNSRARLQSRNRQQPAVVSSALPKFEIGPLGAQQRSDGRDRSAAPRQPIIGDNNQAVRAHSSLETHNVAEDAGRSASAVDHREIDPGRDDVVGDEEKEIIRGAVEGEVLAGDVGGLGSTLDQNTLSARGREQARTGGADFDAEHGLPLLENLVDELRKTGRLLAALATLTDERHCWRYFDGVDLGVLPKYPDQVAPRAALVDPEVNQVQTCPVRKRMPSVWIKTIAVNWIPMDGSSRGSDQKGQCARFQDALNLTCEQPKMRAMLKHLARDHEVERGVLSRDTIGRIQHDIDPRAGFKVETDVLYIYVEEGTVAPVDTLRTQIGDAQPTPKLVKIQADTPLHVLCRSRMHVGAGSVWRALNGRTVTSLHKVVNRRVKNPMDPALALVGNSADHG